MVAWPRLLAIAIATGLLRVGCGGSAPPGRFFTVDHKPSGMALRVDRSPIALRLTYDAAGTADGLASGSADDSDLLIGFVDGSTLKLTNLSRLRLKVDLWTSSDGQRFGYTSSCPLAGKGTSFQSWPNPVRWVYISSPRVLPSEAPNTCQ